MKKFSFDDVIKHVADMVNNGEISEQDGLLILKKAASDFKITSSKTTAASARHAFETQCYVHQQAHENAVALHNNFVQQTIFHQNMM